MPRMTTISVQYPATPGSKFDLDYYMRVHMPLVRARCAAFGMESDQVFKGAGGPTGKETYQITALLNFPALKNFIDAIGAHGAEIMGDIPNFTDTKPVIQFNEPVPG
jgi:uncharacterized protein (TIGR02118 family)